MILYDAAYDALPSPSRSSQVLNMIAAMQDRIYNCRVIQNTLLFLDNIVSYDTLIGCLPRKLMLTEW